MRNRQTKKSKDITDVKQRECTDMMSQLVLLSLCVGTSAPGGTRLSSVLVVRQVDESPMNMSSTNWRWPPLDGTVTTGSFLLALDASELFLQSAHLRLVCIFRQGRPHWRKTRLDLPEWRANLPWRRSDSKTGSRRHPASIILLHTFSSRLKQWTTLRSISPYIRVLTVQREVAAQLS